MMNTIDDLGHPLILETAKNLAWKQVGLGFCAPQDQEDLAQDLLLYLCRQFSRYTGSLPLVTWACRLLRGRINAINRRLLGVPSPSEQRRTRQANVAALSPKRASSPATETERSDGVPLEQVATKQEPAPSTLPERSQTQTVVVFRTVTVPPKRARMERHNPESLREKEPPDAEEPPELNPSPQPENPASNARSRPLLLVLCAEVGSWWQRLLLFRTAIVSRWQRPP